MIPLLVYAFLAGTLTILSPCTLPVVPLLVGAASRDRRQRVTWLLVGFGGTFVLVTVVLASALATAGVTTAGLRTIAAIALGLAGATLVLPWLGRRWEAGVGGPRPARRCRLGRRTGRQPAAGGRSCSVPPWACSGRRAWGR